MPNSGDQIKSSDRYELAREMKDAFDAVSPFIEKHTSIVCPECKTVCCIDKHGRYDEDDLVFLNAFGAEITDVPPDRDETEPCRFLTEKGCSRLRWMRPFRCTFFFCDALLKSLENDNAKLYRTYIEFMQHLVCTREKLLARTWSDLLIDI